MSFVFATVLLIFNGMSMEVMQFKAYADKADCETVEQAHREHYKVRKSPCEKMTLARAQKIAGVIGSLRQQGRPLEWTRIEQ